MSVISVRFPESLHAPARVLAEPEGISINQLMTTSLAENVAALQTSGYLEARVATAARKTCQFLVHFYTR